MEGFFGILKREMFYGFEKQFKNLNELEDAIRDYIEYYNQKRIKIKLKGLTPLEYRKLVLRLAANIKCPNFRVLIILVLYQLLFRLKNSLLPDYNYSYSLLN